MDQPNHPSSFGYKREQFRKSIRRQKVSQIITSMRLRQFPNSLKTIQLSSWEEVNQQLNSLNPNYSSIHLYIDKNQEKIIPQEIQKKLAFLVNRPQFLTNEDSLALLVTLTDAKNQDGKPIFEPDTIKKIVDNLIKQNLVYVKINGQMQERIHYFETVCWTLFSLTKLSEEKQQAFETFRQKIEVFEKCNTQLCLQQIALFASLSQNPSLLPSKQFIIYILNRSLFNQNTPNIIREAMVSLLDNFMRQNQQNPLRFEQQNDKELAQLCFQFINANLDNVAFSRDRKIELIYLLTTLINSADNSILYAMFSSQKSNGLISLIVYNSQYLTWEMKKASLACLFTMMVNKSMLAILLKRISPQDLSSLCYNSLLLPDVNLQRQLVSAIICVCEIDPKTFVKQFTTRNLGIVIRSLEYYEAQNEVNDIELRISQYVALLVEILKKFEATQSNSHQRPESYGEADIEI